MVGIVIDFELSVEKIKANLHLGHQKGLQEVIKIFTFSSLLSNQEHNISKAKVGDKRYEKIRNSHCSGLLNKSICGLKVKYKVSLK